MISKQALNEYINEHCKNKGAFENKRKNRSMAWLKDEMKEIHQDYINDAVSTDRDLREIQKSVYTGELISPVEGANRIVEKVLQNDNKLIFQ